MRSALGICSPPSPFTPHNPITPACAARERAILSGGGLSLVLPFDDSLSKFVIVGEDDNGL